MTKRTAKKWAWVFAGMAWVIGMIMLGPQITILWLISAGVGLALLYFQGIDAFWEDEAEATGNSSDKLKRH